MAGKRLLDCSNLGWRPSSIKRALRCKKKSLSHRRDVPFLGGLSCKSSRPGLLRFSGPLADRHAGGRREAAAGSGGLAQALRTKGDARDRKSTRLNSSHSQISYAVFCLKKKTK